jgi:GT2 family glycosyltransferase
LYHVGIAVVDVTVSIINHNSIETLFDCLEAVERNIRHLEGEIILIDNLCERKAGVEVEKRFPEVRVIDNKVRLGFSANHNQVINQTESDYVLVLNPDVILPSDAVMTMYSFMEENPSVAACGPALIDENGNLQSIVKQLVKPFKETILLACYISDISPDNLPKIKNPFRRQATPSDSPLADIIVEDDGTGTKSVPAQSVKWISGACMFFRRSALKEIGLFDERFFLYFEETDWCLRAKNGGKPIFYLPWITAAHFGGTSTRANYLDNLTVYVKSAVKFYEKHKGTRVTIPLVLTVKSVAAFNVFRWSVLSKLRPETYQTRSSWITFSKKIAFESLESIMV